MSGHLLHEGMETGAQICLKYAAQKYKVCSDGFLYNAKGRKLTPKLNGDGYPHLTVSRCKLKLSYKVTVHRIVAYQKFGDSMFQPGLVVRHLDCDKRNFKPSNLELGSCLDNVGDNTADIKLRIDTGSRKGATLLRRFSEDEITAMRKLRQAGATLSELCQRYSIRSKGHVSQIVNGKIYRNTEAEPDGRAGTDLKSDCT